ncbi:MAG TPA: outer membrane beta-barrel protein [Luteitalea sp.]|nr:outer membrane beta-barrel protein [Luteitalea sp.]
MSLVAVAAVMALGGSDARAQARTTSIEVGGQVNVLRLSDASDTNIGVGGRVTVDVSRWVSLEGEYQFTPSDEFTVSNVLPDGARVGVRYERRRSTAVFGVKAGYRGDRIGVFAKARPGVTRLSNRGVECQGDACALILLVVPEYRPEFVVDLGGVLELYLAQRWVARVDVGTLLIRHRSTAPPCAGTSCTSNNLAASVGLGVRF